MDRRFNEYVALRSTGARESDLVAMYGSERCRMFEAMYQKFFGGSLR